MMMRSKCFFLLLSFCEALVLQRGARPLPRHVLRAREETNDDAVDRRGLLAIAATSLVVGGRSTVAAAEVDEEATAVAAAAAAAAPAILPPLPPLPPPPYRNPLRLASTCNWSVTPRRARRASGEIIVRMPEWAPGCRAPEAVETGYYDNCRFHRCCRGTSPVGHRQRPQGGHDLAVQDVQAHARRAAHGEQQEGHASFASAARTRASRLLNLGDNGDSELWISRGSRPSRVVSGEASVAGLYSGVASSRPRAGSRAGLVSKLPPMGPHTSTRSFRLSSIRSAKAL